MRKVCDLFISNYPPRCSAESVLRAIQSQVERRIGVPPTFLERQSVADGLRATVPNPVQADAILNINGSLILNHPIWIVKLPIELGEWTEAFSIVFETNTRDGIADLGSFAEKFALVGGDPGIVNFNRRDFVEFFLFRLGTEAREKRFWVRTLVVTNNRIESIDPWSTFLAFLPNLREINVRGNPLRARPQLFEWPEIMVVAD
jgi:hypothetical protein